MLNKALLIYQPPTESVDNSSCFAVISNKISFSASALHHFHHHHTH